MIQVHHLTKRYGRVTAVRDLSFEVPRGAVTGFLAPNGAGKSTTMRMIIGLAAPDGGTVTVGGRRYRDLRWPLCEVGALLEARSFHPGRTARAHLAALAASNSIPRSRVGEVLGQTGLADAAGRRAGKFSLGMAQRLGIAAALLGDPAVLLTDEQVNGLDPEGIRWARNLLRSLAAQGRAVFVSSHRSARWLSWLTGWWSSAGDACWPTPRWPSCPAGRARWRRPSSGSPRAAPSIRRRCRSPARAT